jgi:3-keto-L-gulonate-6-phosphate decarboxylase
MSSSGDGPAPPEAALQLALDLTSLDDAAGLVSRLSPDLSRIEIGTPLALAAGFPAIDRIRALSPPAALIVADVKICDAGEKIARSAFAAGADVVTVVAAAIDDTTWRGVLSAAADRLATAAQATAADEAAVGGPVRAAANGLATGRRAAPVLIDTVGTEPDVLALAALAASAAEAGVAVDLCIHRPKSGSPSFADLIAPVLDHRQAFDQLVVAGKLVPDDVGPALEAGFTTLIVGSAVTEAPDPAAAWATFRTEVQTAAQPSAKS